MMIFSESFNPVKRDDFIKRIFRQLVLFLIQWETLQKVQLNTLSFSFELKEKPIVKKLY